MTSFKTLQEILEASYARPGVSADDFESLRKKIYEISMHGFLQDGLTLARMRSVIHTIYIGVTVRAKGPSNLVDDNVEMAQRSACQGLCNAAGLGLTAAGLAFTQFLKFHGSSVPADIGKALKLEALALKDQIDQVTQSAGWLTNTDIARLQAHSFGQLMLPIGGTDAKQADESAISWSDQFFQNCGYLPRHANSNINASLMLLGLLTSGALLGLREAQAAA
jgi:hypothetical protein